MNEAGERDRERNINIYKENYMLQRFHFMKTSKKYKLTI